MITQQIYNSNTTRPFPFAEGSADRPPDDVLVDMSVTVPEGVEPVVTAVSCSPSLFFAALEDSVTRTAIGHFSLRKPQACAVVRLSPVMEGCSGWVVPGPGALSSGLYASMSAELDPSAVLRVAAGSGVPAFSANSVLRTVSGLLELNALNSVLSFSVEDRYIESVGSRRCLVLSRNDAALSVDDVTGNLVQAGTYPDAVYNIAGAFPDNAGNIVIETSPANFTVSEIRTPTDSGEKTIGLLFDQPSEVCGDYDPRRLVLHGRCEQGISSPDGLPCDPLVEALIPAYSQEDCGCDD